MPSTTNGNALPDMANVFKSHPRPEVLKDLLTTYRMQAITHLQDTIPSKITRIRALLAAENDPESPLWLGHVDEPSYTHPSLSQPDDDGVDHKVVKPSDIVATKDTSSEDDMKGVRNGPHWFEVLPLNSVQNDLIRMSVKEHEDLHMVVQDLRVWIELEIPVIEDGNSFGADVQAHLVRELNEAFKRSNAFQNGARAHYGDRLKLAQEWAKYPNLMDFPAAIAASDRFDHFLLRSYFRSLLVVYGGLLTRFERNWTKVTNPKGSGMSGGGMY